MHWEPLGLLWAIMEAYPVEEALNQGVSDELKFVRLINVLVLRRAFPMDGVSVNILLV